MNSVSVVIPAYNRAHIVGRAIDSVLSQTRAPDEIVVVDDCSTDTTREVLANWQKREPRVRPVYLEKNSGPAGARNAGVKAARGDLIAFLDSDDLWLSGHLVACAGLLEADPGLDIAFSDLRRLFVSGEVLQRSYLHDHKQIDQYLAPHPAGSDCYRFQTPEVEVLFRDYVVPIQTTVVRVETARAFPLDETLRGPEDYQFVLRLALAGKRFGFVNRVLCECFLHDSNLVGAGTNLRMCREDIKLWSGLVRHPAVGRRERSSGHRHLARLRHDQGYALLGRGEAGAAVRAYAHSLWHRPSVRAVRGLAKATVGCLTGAGLREDAR